VEPDYKLAGSLLDVAVSDLEAAESNLKAGHPEWAFAIAYNAMLQSGRALMAFKGYRTMSEAHHVGVVRFCEAVLPEDAKGLVEAFERYRKRRHDIVYGEIRETGSNEAARAIENARKFVERIRGSIKR